VVLAGGRRLAFQWSAVPKDVAGEGDSSVDEESLAAELRLRAELVGLSLIELQERAFLQGVDATAVADASLDNEDDSDKRRALVALLVAQQASSSTSTSGTDEAREAGMSKLAAARRGRRPRAPPRPVGTSFGRGAGSMAHEAVSLRRVAASKLEPSLARFS